MQDSLTEAEDWLDVVAALRIGTVENGLLWLRGELGGLEPHALRSVALAAGVETRQSRGEGSIAEVAEDLVRLLAPEAGVVYVFCRQQKQGITDLNRIGSVLCVGYVG